MLGTPDYMTNEGAHLLRQRIVSFWERRGKKVVVEVNRVYDDGGDLVMGGRYVYEVRSNIADLLVAH